MKLEVLKCPSCGANIEFEEDAISCECEYCGAVVTVSEKASQNIVEKVKKISQTQNKKAKKKEPTIDKKGRIRRKGFDITSLVCFSFSAIYAALFLFGDTEIMTTMFSMALFFLIFGIMFKLLSFTPKNSEYLFGKSHGIKTRSMVVICIVLAITSALFFADLEDTDSSTDTPSTTIGQSIPIE